MENEPKVKAIQETDKYPEIWIKLSDTDSEKLDNLIELITKA